MDDGRLLVTAEGQPEAFGAALTGSGEHVYVWDK